MFCVSRYILSGSIAKRAACSFLKSYGEVGVRPKSENLMGSPELVNTLRNAQILKLIRFEQLACNRFTLCTWLFTTAVKGHAELGT